MAKIKKDFRLEEEIIDMMDALIPFLSSEKNIKMNRTMLIEMLISEKYNDLLKRSEGSETK